MSFFNLRRGGASTNSKSKSKSKSSGAAAVQPDSVEVVRKRAKQRLIGAAVLVLLGVIVFPLVFDTQPRSVAVDIPIEIPARNAVKPLTAPLASSPETAATAPKPTPRPTASVVAAGASLQPKEELLTRQAAAPEASAVPAVPPASAAPAAQPAPVVKEAKPELKVTPKVDARPEPKPAAKASTDEAQRAKSLLEGKPAQPAGAHSDLRLVVQVGAFADVNKAREARTKLEKAGLKTYTHVADTKDGKRTRVRVGPFASKAEADKAAAKIKTLDLPATILTL
jgi:DedD protein